MKKILLLNLCLSFTYVSKGQLLYNKGQTIYSEPGTIMLVQGSYENDINGIVDHNGFVKIDSSYINKSGTTKGYGVYDVYKDWVNDSHFIKDTSHVYLKGGNELITGDSVSTFYNLTLDGTGIKRMTINAKTSNILNLNDRELATDQDTMFVLNTNITSIQYQNTFGNEGFVSTLDTGALVRNTNSTNTYVYPMGSSINTNRFRKIELKPNSPANNRYGVSFINDNPTVKGYNILNLDTNLCRVNDKYFHKISSLNAASLTSSVDLEYFYLPIDGVYDAIGNYNLLWTDILNETTNPGAYNSVKRAAWGNFAKIPYALAANKPIAHINNYDTLICGYSTVNLSVSNNSPEFNYNWSATPGTITGGANTNNVNVAYSQSGNYTVGLIITDTVTGCSSNAATFPITVSAGPTANYWFQNPVIINNIVVIKDSSLNANTWFWDFGNSHNDNTNHPQTVYYSAGTYPITLVVTDAMGCKDTLIKEIVIQNLDDIPNIFTPNEDGINDVFLVKNLGMKDYQITILNRWGQVLYEGDQGTAAWDGTTPSGEKCADGTYYYIVTGSISGIKREYKGFLTLAR